MMALSPGTTLGAYQIVGLIGAGGMGEVYKATDTRLNRTVAIKVLNQKFASDPTFRERFSREAKTISQLDHPHICAVFDVGEQSGTPFLVMQYLEGETLAQRLERGALPTDQGLSIAIQIADALSKAHRAGIVHRDLKPGNILLSKTGAKLLDFGLAKASGVRLSSGNASMLATTPPLTVHGTILGTFQYMAPEQLEGQEADARTDIFAFGTVIYEMLTGRKAFDGTTHASVIAAIMRAQVPSLCQIESSTPLSLDRLVAKCLAKDPEARWQTARDLRDELHWIAETAAGPAPSPITTRHLTRERLFATAALIFLVAATALLALVLSSAPAPAPMQFVIQAPNSLVIRTFALSPDGRVLTFSADTPTREAMLYVRPLDALSATALAGTQGARGPFWSPDARFIAFFADGKLKNHPIFGRRSSDDL
jgi:serine/threonine protein kinase